MSDLTDFLLARIAEDEVGAAVMSPSVRVTLEGNVIASAAAVTPTRALAECEAKRKIVELVSLADSPTVHAHAWVWAKSACMALAVVYADHPDYREEWRP